MVLRAVLVPPVDDTALQDLADRREVSVSELLRRAIRNLLAAERRADLRTEARR